MKKVALAIASALAVMMPISGSHAETLQDVLASTYENHPTLKARRANVRSVDELVPQALSGWRPQVFATGELAAQHNDSNLANVDRNTNPREAALTVSQPIYSGGQTIANTKAAEATVSAARAGLVSTEQSVLQQAVEAYMNVRRDEQLVELNRNNNVVLRRQDRKSVV